MVKSYAQVLEEKGIEKGRQEGELDARRATLLRLLRGRLGELPADVVVRIEATNDIRTLDAWFDAGLTAESLEDLDLNPPNPDPES